MQIQALKSKEADIEHTQRLKVKTLRAFALFSVASKRDRELKKNMRYFRWRALATRVVMGLKVNIHMKRRKIECTMAARRHYTHYQSIILNKAFFVMLEYSR